MRRLSVLVPLLVAMAVLFSAMPAAARAPIAIGVSNPDGGGPELAEVKDAVYAHRAAIGRFPALWSLWSRWGDRGGQTDCVKGKGTCRFPTEAVEWLQSKGITPVVWWLPVNPKNWTAGEYERYRRMIWGKHDKYIRQWARDLKLAAQQSGRPVVVRFAHESTGTWFPWSIQNFDNNAKVFKKAWRHIWNQFRGQGALPHTRFLWSQVTPTPFAYPGDKYVHYVGATLLNFGSQKSWKPARKAVDAIVKRTKQFTNKPIFFAEVGSHYKGGNKAQWIKNVYNRAYYKHPKVKAIVYLDTDEPFKLRGHPDWRLVKPDNGSALTAYRNLASQQRFKGKIR